MNSIYSLERLPNDSEYAPANYCTSPSATSTLPVLILLLFLDVLLLLKP